MHDSRRTRIVLGVLLVAAIALITIDVRGGGSSPVRSFGTSAFAPAERAVGDVTGPVSRFFSGLAGGPSANSRIGALQSQNARLRAELSASQLSKSDSSQLSSLLQLAGKGGYRIVAASVIAVGQDYGDRVTLDAGSRDGIRPQETVLNGDGLVGTITQVTSGTSTVLLATDASSVVGARMEGTGQIGAVSGTGKSLSDSTMLSLKLFDANAVLRPGERLVTFGSMGNRPYVPGVPIGQVTRAEGSAVSLTQTATVRPFVNFTSLGVVGVVVGGPRTNPRDSVLPPRPKPTPTVTVTVSPGKHPKSGATGKRG